MGALGRSFGIDSRAAAIAPGRGKSFFLHRLLKDVVFAERGLGAHNPVAERQGEIFLIAKGTGVEPAEAEAWWESSDPIAVQKLIQDIAVVSRLQSKDGKDPNSSPSAPSSRET